MSDSQITVGEVDEFCRKQSPPWGYEFAPWNVWRGQGKGLPFVRDETLPVYAISVDAGGPEDVPEFYEGITWEEALGLACQETGVPFDLHRSSISE